MALSLILSVALLNVLVAMFGSTYGKVMDSAREEWQLQRALTILLLERVLYFLPAILIYPLGYRVLHPAPGKRKVIMRFVWRDGGCVHKACIFSHCVPFTDHNYQFQVSLGQHAMRSAQRHQSEPF